ncbi:MULTISPECIES: carbon-nitrogen hydrolase family protein [unclassified Candidatus Frackibacter]|uniref:carbon-nitrogen hydrolase family protein n=1 Tax=unclassified Candidatus Frackibacter TaxID=2648818 RepID=UPI0007959F90|nr:MULTISPECIES: carbon-nitrogen hydrolase family protein [unclassified Candidatus Frackibacter]KXS40186.1 MAG: Nitrilase/cyanide hydratase and apolipoprotein N-acyltransferase [Candidatus Frackibacter sp. T328-2]SDC33523.1 Predicted amidohydrolase [Candidatus Frackibacter sp. WG11]SEM57634.1 Predicted amidohydrolase [Candidatus Frackibacter sp. WG12]SFM09343.1 Predicted amidohydrolase [Candidatus Frackibacter sp. WG13]
MKTKVKLAICQNKVVDNKDENLQQAQLMINEAAQQNANVVILPEMFNCPYENSYFPTFAESIPEGKTYQMLAKEAKKHNIYLVGGSIPELAIKNDERILYNTSLIFNPEGKLLGRHRKIHLFDVDLSDGVTFLESDTLNYGQQITVVKTEFLNIGVAICYDLRFPELMRLMVDKGAEMIVIPGAFNTVTGPAHWELLLRTRAVDNQAFIVGASPARNHDAEYQAYGHSMIVDPWGRKLKEAGNDEAIIVCNIALDKVKKTRKELPLLKHRRLDLYQLKEL